MKGLFTAFFLILGVPMNDPPTADAVIIEIARVTEIRNYTKPQRDPQAAWPDRYKEHATFSVLDAAPCEGQVFICDTANDCDAIYEYFNALKLSDGSYLYKSKSGYAVMQLDGGLAPEEATKLGDTIARF